MTVDAQTIAIIAVAVSISIALSGIFVPLYLSMSRRIDRLSDQVAETNRLLTALANHRHGGDGAATFISPID